MPLKMIARSGDLRSYELTFKTYRSKFTDKTREIEQLQQESAYEAMAIQSKITVHKIAPEGSKLDFGA
ncbi:hypothetical protein AC578_5147 [Pseudocercospora eumusae]|uniref:Uncharacterized protein n=1 Tax=Pseudocercospora eumusae TaxID=321146 RepID=A0A139HML2_9PEZI|nr:hypothetical protein AC578_5147 [Pseudocercospora eumusae]